MEVWGRIGRWVLYVHDYADGTEEIHTDLTMPVVDGQFKAVLSDVVDIQRYINRLLTLLDFIIGSSAKGLLMVPQECIPDDMNLKDFAREYVKVNGVVLIKKGAGDKLPKQISMNGTNVGIWEMFAQEMNIMQQISGLNGAIQGQVPRANTPSSLYAQQSQNSLQNFLVLFDSFNSYCEDRDEKLLKVLMQYYTTRRYVDTNGKGVSQQAKYYEPEMARRILDFNLTASKSTDTPVFRQMTDDLLMKLLESGRIPLEIFLNNCSIPGADKLQSELKTFNEQAAAGQVDPEQLAALQQTAQQNADPQAMAMLQRYMGAG